MRQLLLAIPVALLLGCPPASTEDEPIDMRRSFPDAPSEGFALTTPEYVIPAGSERQFCWIDTYRGEDVGITSNTNYQTHIGHHLTLFGTSTPERDVADGTSWDCTDTEALAMENMEPIIIGGTISTDADGVTNAFTLPAGMAAPLENGQRLILQSHYINTQPEPVLVQDQAHFVTVPEDDVGTWASPLVATVTNFAIPAQTDGHVIEFDCLYEDSLELLYLGGHLHEWGASFSASHTRDGVTSTIYEVPDWDPVFRDAPLYEEFEPGEFTLAPGDTLTTRCEWDNNTEAELGFPEEMCVTFAMAYPSRVPIICTGD